MLKKTGSSVVWECIPHHGICNGCQREGNVHTVKQPAQKTTKPPGLLGLSKGFSSVPVRYIEKESTVGQFCANCLVIAQQV